MLIFRIIILSDYRYKLQFLQKNQMPVRLGTKSIEDDLLDIYGEIPESVRNLINIGFYKMFSY